MRLIVVVEGQTEEEFVKQVLGPHLAGYGVYASATIVGKHIAQKRGHGARGGGHFRHWRTDIQRILGRDGGADLRVTTLFDLYGLPSDFPGLDVHGTDSDTSHRCVSLEAALWEAFGDRRFIPYIQRHEFEALVFAALPELRELLDAEDDLSGLRDLEQEIGDAGPEDVNDGDQTAPSKRLANRVPGYRKTAHGPLAVAGTGLPTLRARCPRFSAWVQRLEALGDHATNHG